METKNKNESKLTELNEKQLHELANMQVGKAAILFTTPFCGTCKVARKMLGIVAETNVPYHLYEANINFTPFYRQHWQIKSIPALLVLENGALTKTIYAMGSVSELYEQLI